ncbi:MAG: hypothetical protein IH822_12380, partial [Chloroflexi bacterium]|nr:hypothetical protein [Chloroflexota bacterium]
MGFLSFFGSSPLAIALTAILVLVIAAVIFAGVNAILSFSGGPSPCTPGGGPITVNATNAGGFQQKWDGFDAVLDGGSPSSASFDESEVTSRADQYISDETDVDCGGSCLGCDVGANCNVAQDCLSQFCGTEGCTAVDFCANGLQDGNETDIDCGGGTCALCNPGRDCGAASDCGSAVCDTAGTDKCIAGNCSDSVVNGSETDVDCGGSCSGCGEADACLADTDCRSDVCQGNAC